MSRLQPGVLVSGPYGELIETPCNEYYNIDENKKKPKKRKRFHGVIREAVGEKKWKVNFEDGSIKECPSSRLKFVSCRPPPTLVPGSTITRQDDCTIIATSYATVATSIIAPSVDVAATNAAASSIIPSLQENHTASDYNTTMTSTVNEDDSAETVVVPTIGTEYINVHDIFGDDYIITDDNIIDDDQFNDQVVLEENSVVLDFQEDLEEDLVEIDEDAILGEQEIEEDNDEHKQKWNRYIEEKEKLIADGWTVKKGRITWKVCRDSVPNVPISENKNLGVREINWENLKNLSEKLKRSSASASSTFRSPTKKKKKLPTPYLDLFLSLWPGDWQQQLQQMNLLIQKNIESCRKNKKGTRNVREVTPNDFFVFIGIIVISASAQTGGQNLFESAEQHYKKGMQKVLPTVNMTKYMTKTRFEEIRSKFDLAFEDRTKSDRSMPNFDPWYTRFRNLLMTTTRIEQR